MPTGKRGSRTGNISLANITTGMQKYRQFEDNLQTLCEVPMSKWPTGFRPQEVYQGANWLRTKAVPSIRNHFETLTKRLATATTGRGKRATGKGRAKVQTRGTKRAAHAATG